MKLTKKQERSFWTKVDRPDSSVDCWNWTACKTKGYGRIVLDGFWYRAHRVSYEIHHGDIPEGLLVCHSCDNPSCVNPHHLWLGTSADNHADMVAKGRGLSGSKHPQSKLTEVEVERIRKLLKEGNSGAELAVRFGVDKRCISDIKTRRTWRHV